MSKRKRRAYSWDFKAEVLAVYEVDGPAAAARLYEVSDRSIIRWAKACGVVADASVKEATESANAMKRRLYAEIEARLHESCLRMIDRLETPYEDVRMVEGKPVKVTLERPPAKESRDLMWSAAVLVDKVRLVHGDVTDRTETTTITNDQLDREIAELEAQLAANDETED